MAHGHPTWAHAISLQDVDMLRASLTATSVNEFILIGYAEWSPLQYACSRGFHRGVECLLALGADPSAMDRWNWTALQLAASNSNESCARLLLRAGACVNGTNNNARAALSYALDHNCKMPIARMLIEHEAHLPKHDVIPAWATALVAGRNRCRYVALLLVAFRKLRRVGPPSNDVAALLARSVWATRNDEEWQYK